MSLFDVDVVLLPPRRRGGRRRREDERVVTFKVSRWVVERLDRLARKKRVSRSELIREALERFLLEEDEEARQTIEVVRRGGLKPQPIEDDMPAIY